MSVIGDIFNRIRDRFVPNNRKLLDQSQVVDDPVLRTMIRQNTLDYFENPYNYNEYCRNFFSVGDNFAKQYDYIELINQMQQNGAMDEFDRYFAEVQNNNSLYYPSEVHGISHTSRVTFFAEMLCSLDNISAHDKDLIMRAAQLHDIGREDDRKNFDHGFASKIKIEQMGLLSNYPERDQEIIKFAVESHSLEPDQIEEKINALPRRDRKDFRKILDYLQDADKLDRTRIANKGWGLDPNRLATDTAKRLVKVAHENYYEFYNVIEYEKQQEAYQRAYQAKIDGFNKIRNLGYNITFDAFQNIVSEYRPGTLEMLMDNGSIKEIFSYETFKKYKMPGNDETLQAEHDFIYKDVSSNDQVLVTEGTFDREFMLHYNLKKNNPQAYELLNYVNIDKNSGSLVGVIEEIKVSDLEKLHAQGYNIRMTDLVYLASNLTPEEYREVSSSGRFEDLFSSKYEKYPHEISEVKEDLLNLGLNYSDELINQNYRFLQTIVRGAPDVLLDSRISNYTFSEIYAAITKLSEANNRFKEFENLNDTHARFRYDGNDVIDFMNYARTSNLLNLIPEKEQLDVTEKFMEDKEKVQDPRFTQYMVKKNKPYLTENLDEIINYNEFCADEILLDPNISLDSAKRNLINGLFNLDVPPQNRKEFENELLEDLYYHKKYCPNSDLYKLNDKAVDVIAQILNSDNIKDFKDLLFENKKMINLYNTHNIGDTIKADLIEVSKSDLITNLQKTANQIENSQYQTVYATNGTPVNVKVLSGQEFYLATSTAMPKCSSATNKLIREHGADARGMIYDRMLNTEMNPSNACTSVVSDKMVAHAASALQDQELTFAYVPRSKNSISISAMYDLSSKRNNKGERVTAKPITPRKTSDFIAGTKEEHNEAVINGVYPDYIVCYDQVTDIAVQKQQALQKEYAQKGIDKKVDIVLVQAREKYIPDIKAKMMNEHSSIVQKLNTGNFTEQDFDNMFQNHESNFVLRTLQTIHSTSYRDDVWNREFNRRALTSMTEIVNRISEIVPSDKARPVLNQVEILLERANTKRGYGTRFYDHSYAEDIDTVSLEKTRQKLANKVYPYERNGKTSQRTNNLVVEEMNVDSVENMRDTRGQGRPSNPDDFEK